MTRWIEVEKARTFDRHDVPSAVNLTQRLEPVVPVLDTGSDPTLTSEVQFVFLQIISRYPVNITANGQGTKEKSA